MKAAPGRPGKALRITCFGALGVLGVLFVGIMALGPAIYEIPSEANIPGLRPGDRVVVLARIYDLRLPRRGDVVVVEASASIRAGGIPATVGRIVGLPGETIAARRGHITIDGSPIEEPYLGGGITTREFGPTSIPSDSYFVLGDNRPFSNDSRVQGSVDRDRLIGPVEIRYATNPSRFRPWWFLVIAASAVAVAVVCAWMLWRRRPAGRDRSVLPGDPRT